MSSDSIIAAQVLLDAGWQHARIARLLRLDPAAIAEPPVAPDEDSARWTPRIAAASRALGVPPGELLSPSRRAPVARARHAIAAALRLRGLSQPRAGRLLARHHTAILHSERVAMPNLVERVLDLWRAAP